MGKAGRARAEQLFDLRRNVGQLAECYRDTRSRPMTLALASLGEAG